MKSIVNFLFEVGMLKNTPRTGYHFLGSGNESVAEHIMRMTFIGYVMSKLNPAVDETKLIKMCLFHDLPEARIGDQNYVHKKYVKVNEAKAIDDLAQTVFFGEEIKTIIEEFNAGKTEESLLAADADQIEHLLRLKECADLGNNYAHDWIKNAQKRLKTKIGRSLAKIVISTDSTEWWFQDKENDWWVKGK